MHRPHKAKETLNKAFEIGFVGSVSCSIEKRTLLFANAMDTRNAQENKF